MYQNNNNKPYSDVESGQSLVGFSETSVRHGFIRKVYGILVTQLLVTFGISALFVLDKNVGDYVRQNRGMLYSAYIITIVTILVLACAKDARRRFPTNMILLSVFTLAESYLVGTICAFYDTDVVLKAVATTAIIVVALTLFAFQVRHRLEAARLTHTRAHAAPSIVRSQTKIDFTLMTGSLLSILMAFIIFGFLVIFFPSSILRSVYASLGALLFSVFIVYDTQLLLGGSKYQLSQDEYVFAALNLYLDIINLFCASSRVLMCCAVRTL